jgi:hypothetical protein
VSASKDHVVSGLVEKRRELAGIIDELQRQLDQHRADLTHIDGVLRVLAADLDLDKIRPKRVYRRTRYFARNDLTHLVRAIELGEIDAGVIVVPSDRTAYFLTDRCPRYSYALDHVDRAKAQFSPLLLISIGHDGIGPVFAETAHQFGSGT